MNFNEWKVITISNLILSSNTGLDAIKRAPIVDYDSGVKCLRIQDISQEKEFRDWGFCSVEDKDYIKFQLKKGDIIVARTGATVGVNRIIKENLKSVFNNGLIRIKVNEAVADNKFLYYNMQSEKYRGHINAISGGTSTQPNMKMNALLDFEINLPNLQEQQKIVSILSALDNKIELNNRMNKVLEKVAQAFFKQWFVDFEFPNENGKPYKFSGGEMEWCEELGKEIPKGWKIGSISDLGTVVGGGTPSSTNEEYYSYHGVPWIIPKDLSTNKSKFIFRGSRDITELGLRNSAAKLMPEGTVLFTSRAPIGYIAIAGNPVTTNQGFKSVIPNVNVGTEYVYCFLKENLTVIENMATGSTFKEISGNVLKNISALLPETKLLMKFSNIIKIYNNKIKNNEKQINYLTNLRDTLLPKLMSGEIDVSDIEI
ncbi:restriction endonuclease subunit S [Paenibacillus sp. 1-18]|uniref:restriction endonuclease subunit S n=1 Tax=Paenibacillus sp. 1-18 TaxID=1333846 RepID=UPI000471D079|nr:restriction endonuclease subunit S [Paenibacillus sp. 1-18]